MSLLERLVIAHAIACLPLSCACAALPRDVDLCRYVFTCMIGNMKHSSAGIVMVLVAALVAPIQGIAASDPVMVDSAVLGDSSNQLASSAPETTIPNQPPLAVPSAAVSSADVRDIPSISGRYAIGGRTLLPYIGAGFSGGYSSEFGRSLAVVPPTQNDFGLRSQFGQSVSPNEFQVGIRIPLAESLPISLSNRQAIAERSHGMTVHLVVRWVQKGVTYSVHRRGAISLVRRQR